MHRLGTLLASRHGGAPVASYLDHRRDTALCGRSSETAAPEFGGVACRSCGTGAEMSATCRYKVPPVFPSAGADVLTLMVG